MPTVKLTTSDSIWASSPEASPRRHMIDLMFFASMANCPRAGKAISQCGMAFPDTRVRARPGSVYLKDAMALASSS